MSINLLVLLIFASFGNIDAYTYYTYSYGLSSGAYAGIVIGSIVFICACVFLGIWFRRRYYGVTTTTISTPTVVTPTYTPPVVTTIGGGYGATIGAPGAVVV